MTLPWETMTEYQILDLTRKRDSKKEQLLKQAARIIDRMDRLIRELNSVDPIINSLGELQASAPDLDRLCGEFSLLRDLVEGFEKAKVYDLEHPKNEAPVSDSGP